jgi:hypothetical protein
MTNLHENQTPNSNQVMIQIKNTYLFNKTITCDKEIENIPILHASHGGHLHSFALIFFQSFKD